MVSLTTGKLVISNCVKSSTTLFSQSTKRTWLGSYEDIRNFAVAGVQEKIQVSNVMLNVEIVGNGPHKILCLPGSLGSIETDLAPQLQKLNRDSFTIIAWDPPGYRKSRPPDRDLKLGHEKFSLLGWSDGATTAIFMASLFPQSVHRMVLLASQSFTCDKDKIAIEKVRDIDDWSEKMKKPFIDMYGEEYFRKTWAGWMDGYIALANAQSDIRRDNLASVNCPTFVIHGAKDVMVDKRHSEYIHKHIKNSKLYIMPEGKHNLHLRYPDEFDAMVEEFLLEK